MVVARLASTNSQKLCDKLSKGSGHNDYGEPAWPNDILYIFPLAIGIWIGITTNISTLHETRKIESGTPFATPLEIVPEWYLMSVFNLLRILSDKLVGVLTMLIAPAHTLATTAPNENATRYQNPLRRPVSQPVYMIKLQYSIWEFNSSVETMDKALPLL